MPEQQRENLTQQKLLRLEFTPITFFWRRLHLPERNEIGPGGLEVSAVKIRRVVPSERGYRTPSGLLRENCQHSWEYLERVVHRFRNALGEGNVPSTTLSAMADMPCPTAG